VVLLRRLVILLALLIVAVLGLVASALGSPSSAAGTPPFLDSMTQRDGQLRLKYSIVTSGDDPWVIEVAATTELDRYGAFVAANLVSSSGLIRVPLGATSINFTTPRLRPGRYYVHAARDATASFMESWWALCRILGCIPNPPPDFRVFDWSSLSKVTITPPCVTPRVIGLKLRRARPLLRRSRCVVGRIKRVASRRPSGLVLSQSPSAGRRLPTGSRVNLVVAA
jgi:hypothetical protein